MDADTVKLLEEVYAAAVASGHRDDPLMVKLAAVIKKAKPKEPEGDR